MKVYESREKDVEVPALDVLTFLFDSNYCGAKEDTKIHVEAANPSNSVTKSEARQIVKRVAHTFREQYGIGASGDGKDVILATSSGNPFIPVLFYASIAAGGVFSGASTAFTVNELVRQVKDGDAKLLLCSQEFEERTVEAAKQCGISRDRILVIDSKTPKDWKLIPSGGSSNVLDLVNGPQLEWRRMTDREEAHGVTGCLLYSSGTTGLPKGVRMSHKNLIAANTVCMRVGDRLKARREKEGEPFIFTTIAHLPMAHIAGIAWYSLNPFYMGGTTYWMVKYDFQEFIGYHRKYRPTVQMSVPPIWLQVAKSAEITDHFDNVAVACNGAAPMGLPLSREVGKKLGKGKTQISQFWGLTEATGSITGLDWDIKDDTGSVGALLPNLRLRILDENDQDVEEGQPGELLVSGPIIFQAYHNREEATKEAFLDGFFRTGDIGLWQNGLLYIVDRKKELIKYKGLQVAPAELEATLISHPKINDAAVIGIQDDSQATEVPRAYCVKKPGTDVSAEDVKDYVRQQLANHKHLRGGVVFIDEVPKSPSGKILRRTIRDWVASETPKAKL